MSNLFIIFALQIEAGDVSLSFPIFVNSKTWDTHIFPVFFGGTKVSADSNVISAPAVQMVYFVAVDTKRQIQMYVFICAYYGHSGISNGFIFFFTIYKRCYEYIHFITH